MLSIHAALSWETLEIFQASSWDTEALKCCRGRVCGGSKWGQEAKGKGDLIKPKLKEMGEEKAAFPTRDVPVG